MKRKKKYKYSNYKQGIYRPVDRQKYAGNRLPQYRSSWELKFFQWCDKNPNVVEWSSESVVVPYKSPIDNRVHRYFIDSKVLLKEGDNNVNYLVEIKPSQQTKPPVPSKRKKPSTVLYEKMTYAINQAKWDAARQFAKKRNMSFIILTENELNIK